MTGSAARPAGPARKDATNSRGLTLVGIAAVLSLAAVLGCEPRGPNSDDAPPAPPTREAAADPDVWLVDVTATWGVDFIHTTGGTDELYLPEIMGAAWPSSMPMVTIVSISTSRTRTAFSRSSNRAPPT